jgi:hypothetical protein
MIKILDNIFRWPATTPIFQSIKLKYGDSQWTKHNTCRHTEQPRSRWFFQHKVKRTNLHVIENKNQ